MNTTPRARFFELVHLLRTFPFGNGQVAAFAKELAIGLDEEAADPRLESDELGDNICVSIYTINSEYTQVYSIYYIPATQELIGEVPGEYIEGDSEIMGLYDKIISARYTLPKYIAPVQFIEGFLRRYGTHEIVRPEFVPDANFSIKKRQTHVVVRVPSANDTILHMFPDFCVDTDGQYFHWDGEVMQLPVGNGVYCPIRYSLNTAMRLYAVVGYQIGW
jgi:hypothetical protein